MIDCEIFAIFLVHASLRKPCICTGAATHPRIFAQIILLILPFPYVLRAFSGPRASERNLLRWELAVDFYIAALILARLPTNNGAESVPETGADFTVFFSPFVPLSQ